MGDDRYSTRHGSRGEQDRWQERGSQGRGRGDERGFFERAGDEIASWLGDDDDRERGSRQRQPGGSRDRSWTSGRDEDERSRFTSRDRDEDSNWFGGRERGSERMDRDRFDRGGSGWQDQGRGREERQYRPIAGDYGRSGMGGSEQPSGHHDPHYRQWRERHMQELDRDYHEYHRERQTHFENDFGSWRERRQQKRQTISKAGEHMEVVGSDGQRVGTVDKIAGDRLILTKSDPEAGGMHHSISCNDVDRIEEGRVILECSAEQARQRWRNEDHSRALFEGEDRSQGGPHVLDRSFSGTYRD